MAQARQGVQSAPTTTSTDDVAREDPRPVPAKVSYANLHNKKQLAILCVARLAEPLAATSIQTYMFHQLKFFNPTASDATISTQAGILTGAKTAAQVCTGIFWGSVADKDYVGRKPVLVLGLLSAGLACIGFGLSKSFTTAITWQIVGGSFNSNLSMVRCVTAETYPEKRYRARALTLLPLCANTGMLLGPLIGGLLSSQPGRDTKVPYPYLLPNLCIAIMYLVSALGVVFTVKETLTTYSKDDNIGKRVREFFERMYSRLHGRQAFKYSALSTESPISPATDYRIENPVTPRDEASRQRRPSIWTVNVFCTLLTNFIIAGHLGTFSILWSVFLSSPVEHRHGGADQPSFLKFGGGLGMQPRSVGVIMSILGAITVFLQIVIYPKLSDRFGTVDIWRNALYAFPIAYFCAPFPALIASEAHSNKGFKPEWAAVAGVLLIFGLGRTGATPATTMLINDCAPHPSVRATIHSMATVFGNLARSIFPVTALALFGEGLKTGAVGLAFWCLMALAILSCVASRFVRGAPNDGDAS